MLEDIFSKILVSMALQVSFIVLGVADFQLFPLRSYNCMKHIELQRCQLASRNRQKRFTDATTDQPEMKGLSSMYLAKP